MKTGRKVVEVNVQTATAKVWSEGPAGENYFHVFQVFGRTRWTKDGNCAVKTPEETLTQVATNKSSGFMKFPASNARCIYIDRRRIIRMEIDAPEPHWKTRTATLDCAFEDDDGDPLKVELFRVVSETIDPPKPSLWSRFAFWRAKP